VLALLHKIIEPREKLIETKDIIFKIMSIKEDLLKKMNLTNLKRLAEENKIRLVGQRTNWNSLSQEKYALTNKEDIIELLAESSKISEKKIREFSTPKEEKQENKIKDDTPRKIPRGVKTSVWYAYIGDKTEAKCYVCGDRTIHITDFDCGHVIAVANGGGDSVDNLRPVCRPCNAGMGTMNLEDYKEKYYPKTKNIKSRK
jgi:5-methylcytosine-specific restriction endonuclease McrA